MKTKSEFQGTRQKQNWVYRISSAGMRCLVILSFLSLGITSRSRATLLSGSKKPTVQGLQAASPRRVNIPYFTSTITWNDSAIFWFGVNEQGLPSRNYVDVRVGYNNDGLSLHATVVDYYLWYAENAQPGDDLTQFDGMSIYLDKNHDRAGAPQNDDYTFLIGARFWEEMSNYMRQGRGNGTGWDNTWTAGWTADSWMQWFCDPGPNSNDCDIDFGWVVTFTIPWAALGLSGPPDAGTLWGMGVQLYDRDQPQPAGTLAPEYWPETFNAGNPATWGEIHFGYANYQPPVATASGTTTIRAASPTDHTVEDSYNGGAGDCSGGNEGGSEINHGDATGLFVASQTAPTDFPCFSKSYLRFSLDSIPAGKVIISATLTLHLWGNAGAPGQAQPSWVSLFTITDPWDEMGINWNNAPLAQENVSQTWVYPDPDNFAGYPGDPYNWDATQAVAEAYAQGLSANMALYESDTDMHSSKYLTSSQAEDWNAEGRPRLTVIWGDAAAQVSKQVTPARVSNGDQVTYTLDWSGVGQAMSLTDTLPDGLSEPSALEASFGSASYNPATRTISWSGSPATGQAVTLSYTVIVQVSGPLSLQNTAILTSPLGDSSSSAILCIDCLTSFLPYIRK